MSFRARGAGLTGSPALAGSRRGGEESQCPVTLAPAGVPFFRSSFFSFTLAPSPRERLPQYPAQPLTAPLAHGVAPAEPLAKYLLHLPRGVSQPRCRWVRSHPASASSHPLAARAPSASPGLGESFPPYNRGPWLTLHRPRVLVSTCRAPSGSPLPLPADFPARHPRRRLACRYRNAGLPQTRPNRRDPDARAPP